MKTLTIAVGYSWAPNLKKDKRWVDLKKGLLGIQQEVLKRWESQVVKPDEIELEAEVILDKTARSTNVMKEMAYHLEIKRLRSAPGRMIWPTICERIQRADLVVMDLTPREGEESTRPSVLLELGYALAQESSGLPVYVVVSDYANQKHLVPSDLQGLHVGVIPVGGVIADASLRRALVNDLIQQLTKIL